MIVSRRGKAPLRGAARMAAISAGGAQPTVLAAVALWLSLNPNQVFLLAVRVWIHARFHGHLSG